MLSIYGVVGMYLSSSMDYCHGALLFAVNAASISSAVLPLCTSVGSVRVVSESGVVHVAIS